MLVKEYGAKSRSSIAHHEACTSGRNQDKTGLKVKAQLYNLKLRSDRPPACFSRCIIASLMQGHFPHQTNFVIADCKLHQHRGGRGSGSIELIKLTLGRMFILIMAILPRREFGSLDHLSRSATTLLSVLEKLFFDQFCKEEQISTPRLTKFLLTGIGA